MISIENLRAQSHNPYFIGMNLAIQSRIPKGIKAKKSQSLFYWNEPCNIKIFNLKTLKN